MSNAATDSQVPSEYTTPEGLRTLANYLRNTVKVRSGIQMEKRVDYFKGTNLRLLLKTKFLKLIVISKILPWQAKR